MKITMRALVGATIFLVASTLFAQDWPQWRGPNRDGKALGFKVPQVWPKELTLKWKVNVGDGVATPALVGEKLYVFTREGSDEILRCLDANTGKELWQDKYPAEGATGAARGFPGPRSSPTVAEGKVVTLGVRGTLTCYDAATGKKIWQKDEFKAYPRFFTSSSPLVLEGLCIAQLGGERNGAIVAYDLATGAEKWKWSGGEPTSYSSPVLLTVGDSKQIVAETDQNVVGLAVADGKVLWKMPFAARQRSYNAATPMVEGSVVLYTGSGRGTRAAKVEKEGDKLSLKELWNNSTNGCQYNTPVLKEGLVYGITDRDNLFCLDAKTGKTLWTTALKGGSRGYGSVVDAGTVLLGLIPSGQLFVFEPTEKGYKQLATYKVGDGSTYAYPVLAGNRLYIKDKNSVQMWTLE